MHPRRVVLAIALSAAIIAGSAGSSRAANLVYVHGRSMSTWPVGGRLVASSAWHQISLSFNGSARLGDAGVRTYVRDQIRTACTSADCVVVCYSAGCARTLTAYSDLAAEGTTLRVLFTEALASAAGGTELASYSTNNGLRLLAKIFLTNPGPPAELVDNDLPPDNMRYGTWGFIQNAATAPIYHLAGRNNICIKTKIRGLSFLASSVASWVGADLLPAGPVGWVIGGLVGALFGSIKVTLCGNRVMPGGFGDGAVPVHSAAGYADAGAHGDHADGAAKYVFRAYEQVPLFAQDHVGIFRPGVQLGSLRVAVASATATQCIDAANTADTGESPASIVYEDADSSTGSLSEVAPIALLQICGNDMFATSGEQPMYATCYGQGGCCDNFSTGATSGCTCGETVCTQASREYRSYFTGQQCSGYEYTAVNDWSWDGQGMVGATAVSVSIRSIRKADGTCIATTRALCDEFIPFPGTFAARQIYRPYVNQYGPNPQGWVESPGIVVSRVAKCLPG